MLAWVKWSGRAWCVQGLHYSSLFIVARFLQQDAPPNVNQFTVCTGCFFFMSSVTQMACVPVVHKGTHYTYGMWLTLGRTYNYRKTMPARTTDIKWRQWLQTMFYGLQDYKSREMWLYGRTWQVKVWKENRFLIVQGPLTF